MEHYDLMRRAAELDQHRQTLIREVCDIHTLIGNALLRLATVQELVAGDETLGGMWMAALNGQGKGDEITSKDIGELVSVATTLKQTAERINDKRPVFWAKPEPVKEEVVESSGVPTEN